MSDTDEKKTIWESKTYWGALLTWVTTTLQSNGIDVGALTEGALPTQVLVTVFLLYTIYGRVTANTKIGK